MIGSIRIAAVFRPDRALGRFEIGEWHLVEALDHRTEAVEIFLLAAGRQRGERASVEGALESDDAVALRPAARRLVFARHFDRAFHRLGAGIAEEHDVREARRAQPLGQPLALGDAVEIGNMPDLAGLLGDRLDQVRMGMAERVDRHARREVEVAVAVGRDEPRALAALERKIDARVGRQQMRCLERYSSTSRQSVGNEMCRLSGRHDTVFYCSIVGCQHDPRTRMATAANVNALHKYADKCGRMA